MYSKYSLHIQTSATWIIPHFIIEIKYVLYELFELKLLVQLTEGTPEPIWPGPVVVSPRSGLFTVSSVCPES